MIRPKNVFIVLHTDCDKRGDCPYCFYNVQPERSVPSKLDAEKIASLLKRLALLNVKNVYLTGGEPLLRGDLEDVVSAASVLRMNTFLLSNGRSLDAGRAARLEASGLDVFILSLNSLSLADKMTIATARRFKKTALSFIFVLTGDNTNDIRPMTELARALDSGLIFQPAWAPEGHPLRLSVSPAADPFKWSRVYSELRPWAAELGYEKYLELMFDAHGEKKLRPPSCSMGSNSFIIDADGSVFPCFHRRDLPCGNIRRNDIAEILDRVSSHSTELSSAACFGEHCVSLHTSYGKQAGGRG